MWFNITGVFGGAIDEDRFAASERERDEIFEEVETLYAADDSGEPWEIYVTPHYCDPDSDEECTCVQYLTDHHPAASFYQLTKGE